MRKKIESYGLDIHGEVIIEEYRDKISVFRKIEKIAVAELNKALEANNISIYIIKNRKLREIVNTRIHKYLFLGGPSPSGSPPCIKIVSQ